VRTRILAQVLGRKNQAFSKELARRWRGQNRPTRLKVPQAWFRDSLRGAALTQQLPWGGFEMPVVVTVHRLKNFDEWFKLFKSNPPPKVGRWRVLRGSEDRNRVHVVAELASSEVKEVKDFIQSKHMQDVFRQVNDISTAPMEFVWLEEQTITSLDKAI